ncbi:U-box domain-containing protein 45 [Beta vulgaris subsp. vulgaris]|uniref:U-box domain-containing protein 45 n=1 Tax=Beta vulgaris subsp. vulgaris TaxID=3555 RepID=UPI00203713FE|nr:U-box domain-containing protein 45 [Beta vulgaris subsp. vulgaris]
MDIAELEENLFAISDAKLHGGLCKILSNIFCKVLNIFPALEAARPRSRSGIQALCSLHVALEKARNLLQHCSECSKLYLAITGDSVVLKFERTKCALVDGLRRVEDIVPQSIGCQVQEIVSELEETVFSLDPSEKQVGDDLIGLLQKGRKFDDSSSDSSELESFHRAASKLGITSSRAALAERRCLKKLIEKARIEEDKRKESIVAYLLHLMRKYSKLFRSDLGDDQDSQGSGPCSPTVNGSSEDGVAACSGRAFDRQLSKISSFNFRPSFSFRANRRSDHIPIPPEELRCPISLQLMYDPVIIASGQTYERICIEKWFNDGHNTCPKTQQQLSHRCLTPNYCVKGLIASWCEQNGILIPGGPPDSLDLNYWRLALSDSESAQSRSADSSNSGNLKGVKVVPLETAVIEEIEDESCSGEPEENDDNVFGKYENFLTVLRGEEDLKTKLKVIEQIRRLLKDDEEARMFMGSHGFVEVLVGFLKSALGERNDLALEVGAMALFNLAVNNNRNKELMLAAGVVPLLEKMITDPVSQGLAAALYLNLSCLDEAKPVIGSSRAVSFLIKLLVGKSDPQWKLDALHALFNISTCPSNIPNLLQSGIINGLLLLLIEPRDQTWTEKSIAVLINLASNNTAKDAITSAPGFVGALASIMDTGEPIEQEQAVSCLLILCNGNEKCCQMVLQEGVIPTLVSIQVNGTTRGREKAQKLLMLFREQRQRESSPQRVHRSPSVREFTGQVHPPEMKPLSKSISEKVLPLLDPTPIAKAVSRKKLGRTFSFFGKRKNF